MFNAFSRKTVSDIRIFLIYYGFKILKHNPITLIHFKLAKAV